MENSTLNGAVKETIKSWKGAKLIGQVPFEDSIKEVDEYLVHAAHCLIWAKIDEPNYGLDKDKSQPLHPRAAIMMHLRFDGHIGFLGGKIDEQINSLSLEQAQDIVTDSLNRELMEEANVDPKHKVSMKNYLFTHHLIREITETPIFAHFFQYEMSIDELREMESRSLASPEHGREVFGNFRVPLYTMSDGYRGLPAFLTNNFIGNSRHQLITAVVKLGIMTEEEVQQALKASLLKTS